MPPKSPKSTKGVKKAVAKGKPGALDVTSDVASTGMTPSTMYGKWNQSEIEKYFEFLKQGETSDQIGTTGLRTLVRELKMDWMSYDMLVLMWKLRVSRMGIVSRGEWNLAMYNHGITQQVQLRSKVSQWLSDVRDDKESFTEMYNFLYDFLRGESLRWMDKEKAIASWVVLIPNSPFMKHWCQFIKQSSEEEISRDIWRQIWVLFSTHETNFNDYETDGKWPVAIDEFVAWYRSLTV